MSDDIRFSRGPARRPLPRLSDPLLQWSKGLQTNARRIYVGWYSEFGKDADLDDAAAGAGYTKVTLRHGRGEAVTHWEIPIADLFVIAEGVQSIGEMKAANERYGIAFWWATHPTNGKPFSNLRCRVFLRDLLTQGYQRPLTLTLNGTITGDMIAALTRQYEVLDAVDAIRKEDGKPPLCPPFYAASIELAPGQEQVRKSKNAEAQKEITPMIALMPEVMTRDYILHHWTKRPWVSLIEGLLDQTIAWSKLASAVGVSADGEEPNGEEANQEESNHQA
jgi:hypothetical protein